MHLNRELDCIFIKAFNIHLESLIKIKRKVLNVLFIKTMNLLIKYNLK